MIRPQSGSIYLRKATALKYNDIPYYQPVHYTLLKVWNMSKTDPPVDDVFDVNQWIDFLRRVRIKGKPLTQEDEYGNKISYSVTITGLNLEDKEMFNLESRSVMLFPPHINRVERDKVKAESELKGIILHRVIDYNLKYLHKYLPKRPVPGGEE